VGERWRQKQNGSLPSSEKLQRNMVAILFSHRYVGPMLPLPLALPHPLPLCCPCMCVFRICCIFCLFRGFFFSFFPWPRRRVGYVIAQSRPLAPLPPQPSRRPKIPPFWALFSFIYISKATPPAEWGEK